MNTSHAKTKAKTEDSEAQKTTDHDVIRKWVDQRGGKPATVKATEEDGHAGILRIDFDPPIKAWSGSAGTNSSRSSTKPG